MFVLLKGASKEEAFRIGKEIGDRVTALNPKPVKLKFEKVIHVGSFYCEVKGVGLTMFYSYALGPS